MDLTRLGQFYSDETAQIGLGIPERSPSSPLFPATRPIMHRPTLAGGLVCLGGMRAGL